MSKQFQQECPKTHHFHDWDVEEWAISKNDKTPVLINLTKYEAIEILDKVGSRNPSLHIIWNGDRR